MAGAEIPDRWRALCDYLADAQTAERIMTNPALPADRRDAAGHRHAIAVAALVDALAELRRDGVLEAVEDCLRERFHG